MHACATTTVLPIKRHAQGRLACTPCFVAGQLLLQLLTPALQHLNLSLLQESSNVLLNTHHSNSNSKQQHKSKGPTVAACADMPNRCAATGTHLAPVAAKQTRQQLFTAWRNTLGRPHPHTPVLTAAAPTPLPRRCSSVTLLLPPAAAPPHPVRHP
jgi:hypothetical protein